MAYPVPDKKVDVSGSYSTYENSWTKNEGAEYIGGDAYNYQIEAILKAGYFSGVLVMRSVTSVGGILLFFYTLLSSAKDAANEWQTRLLSDLKQSTTEGTKILRQLSEQLKQIIEKDEGNGEEPDQSNQEQQG